MNETKETKEAKETKENRPLSKSKMTANSQSNDNQANNLDKLLIKVNKNFEDDLTAGHKYSSDRICLINELFNNISSIFQNDRLSKNEKLKSLYYLRESTIENYTLVKKQIKSVLLSNNPSNIMITDTEKLITTISKKPTSNFNQKAANNQVMDSLKTNDLFSKLLNSTKQNLSKRSMKKSSIHTSDNSQNQANIFSNGIKKSSEIAIKPSNSQVNFKSNNNTCNTPISNSLEFNLKTYINKAPKKYDNINKNNQNNLYNVKLGVSKEKQNKINISQANNAKSILERSASSKFKDNKKSKSKNINCDFKASFTKLKEMIKENITIKLQSKKNKHLQFNSSNTKNKSYLVVSTSPVNNLIKNFSGTFAATTANFSSGNKTKKNHFMSLSNQKPNEVKSKFTDEDKKAVSLAKAIKKTKVFRKHTHNIISKIDLENCLLANEEVDANNRNLDLDKDIMLKIKSNLPEKFIHYLNFSYNDFYLPSKNQSINTTRTELD